MKALLCREFGPIENLRVEDVPDPSPGEGEVLVEVKASSLNFPDVLIVQGLYQVKPPLPFSPGMELAGVVREAGPGVTAFKRGDRVIASPGGGGFAEACVVAADALSPLPEGMDFAQGASLVLTYSTTLHALQDCAALKPGETLLVLGASGGVGSAAIEIGNAMGARVIAAAAGEEKLAFCRSLGAAKTIDYALPDLQKRILEATDGDGADVVYDPVGGAYTEPALRATAWRGRLLVVGFASGVIPQVKLNLALLKERSIVGVYWGSWAARNPQAQRDNVAQLSRWFGAGKIKPAVTEHVPLADAPAAMQRMARRQIKGKVVVAP
jgi:NADPH2:quinone reductase